MKKITAALLLTAMLASLATAASAAEIGYNYAHHVSRNGESLFRIEYAELEETEEEEEDTAEEESEDSGYTVTVLEPVVAEGELKNTFRNTYTYTASAETAKNVSRLTFDLAFHVNTEEEEETDDDIIYAWITDCTGEDDCICRQCLEERKPCTCDDCSSDDDGLTTYSMIDIAVYGSVNPEEYGWERISVSSASVEDGTANLELDTGKSYTDFKVVISTDGQAEIDNLYFTKLLTFRHLGDTIPAVQLNRYAKYFN